MNTSLGNPAAGAAGRDIKQLFGPYIVGQLVLVTVMQVIVWVRGPKIDVIDGLLLVPSWAYMVWFQYRHRFAISQVRFGGVVAHAATFAIVNGSYHLAAMARAITTEANGAPLPLDGSWFGPLIAMTAIWSVFLVAHIAASVAQRGFES